MRTWAYYHEASWQALSFSAAVTVSIYVHHAVSATIDLSAISTYYFYFNLSQTSALLCLASF